MPLSHKRELKSEFISRCLSNERIQNDFDEQEARLGVCCSLFKHKQLKADYVVDTEGDTYLYTISPEDEPNALDHPSDDPKTPEKTPDKWPTEAPKALDDIKASDFVKPSDYKKSDQSNPPASFPSLSGPGINPNPDNSKNFHVISDGDWENPTIDDQKWFLAIPQDYAEPHPDIEKMKEYYIAEIDKMEEEGFKNPKMPMNAKWPLSFDKIEKDFDRPNKQDTPESRLKEKQNKENLDPNNVDKRDKPYII